MIMIIIVIIRWANELEKACYAHGFEGKKKIDWPLWAWHV